MEFLGAELKAEVSPTDAKVRDYPCEHLITVTILTTPLSPRPLAIVRLDNMTVSHRHPRCHPTPGFDAPAPGLGTALLSQAERQAAVVYSEQHMSALQQVGRVGGGPQ